MKGSLIMYELIVTIIIFISFLVLAVTHNDMVSYFKDLLPFVIGYWFKAVAVANNKKDGGIPQ